MPRKTFTHDGKRYSVQAKSDIELGMKIANKIKQIDSGEIILNKNTTVKRYVEEWLETNKKNSYGDQAFYDLKKMLDNHVVSAIGHMKIKDVKRTNLQKIINDQKGKSRSHIKKLKVAIESIFSYAKVDKLIIDNPTEKLDMIKSEDGSHRALTEKETKYILELAQTHPSGLWIKIMYYCGLRPQETAPLQWKHIDLKNRVIKIELALDNKTSEVKPPKSKAGKRKIPIPKPLYDDLVKVKGEPFQLLFTQPTTGKMHTKSSMRSLWSNFKRDLNIAMGCKVYRSQLIKPFPVADDLVPYCMRHTYCTNLQAAGIPINIAREWMGHEDITTTSKYYTHESEDAFQANAKLLDQYYEPKKLIKKLKKGVRKLKVVMVG